MLYRYVCEIGCGAKIETDDQARLKHLGNREEMLCFRCGMPMKEYPMPQKFVEIGDRK
jgi:hypothetical protein